MSEIPPLVYVGLTKTESGPRVHMTAPDGRQWNFDLGALETRIANRKKQKLSLVEEIQALAALKGATNDD